MAKINPVFFYYPNLLGYARILMAFLSFFTMTTKPFQASIYYFISAFLDAFDGFLARKYKQETLFGAMLDQLTDRCAFLGLLMVLCMFYPTYFFLLQFVSILDIASHWLHLHASVVAGSGEEIKTHKQSKNPILNYYYTSKPFLSLMCLGNEAFYGFLYLAHFWPGPSLYFINFTYFLALLVFPIAALKSGISLVHLATASQTIAELDLAKQNHRKRTKERE